MTSRLLQEPLASHPLHYLHSLMLNIQNKSHLAGKSRKSPGGFAALSQPVPRLQINLKLFSNFLIRKHLPRPRVPGPRSQVPLIWPRSKNPQTSLRILFTTTSVQCLMTVAAGVPSPNISLHQPDAQSWYSIPV